MSSSLGEETLSLINELDLKTVLVENDEQNGKFPSVTIDNEKATYEATKHLIDKGMKQIAFIGVEGDLNNAWGKRYKGYQVALKDAKIEVKEELTFFKNLKVKTGYDAILNMIENGQEIDGIICASDEIAMGAINALRDKGIRVPEDISVMGFSDIDLAHAFYPKLTTVSQPMYDMGSIAMRMLIKIINNKPLDQEHFVLEHNLIERDSCK